MERESITEWPSSIYAAITGSIGAFILSGLIALRVGRGYLFPEETGPIAILLLLAAALWINAFVSRRRRKPMAIQQTNDDEHVWPPPPASRTNL